MADSNTNADGSQKQRHPAGPPPGATEPPAHVTTPKTYEVFNPPPPANALPAGYGQNTAGGRPEKVSIEQALKTIRLEDLKTVHKQPCVRESLLTAIGSAFVVGGGRMLFGGMSSLLCNYSLWNFMGGVRTVRSSTS